MQPCGKVKKNMIGREAIDGCRGYARSLSVGFMAVVSIVVRTKDRAVFLRRALASIALQNDPLVEVVVVNDGGSVAEVEAVVAGAREAGLAVNLVNHAISLGRGAAWNAGWRMAKGEWLAALDDDDTWAPDFLSSVRAEIDARGGGSGFGVATQSMEIRERAVNGRWEEVERIPFNPMLQTVRVRDLVLFNRFTNNAFVFHRAALAEVGGVKEHMDVLEDWDFNARFAVHFPIHVVARPLAHYHKRPPGGGGPWANSDLARHLAAADEMREAWLREDLKAGRWGLGSFAILTEIETNRGLRLFNRLAAWWHRVKRG